MGLRDRFRSFFVRPAPETPESLELKQCREMNAVDIQRFNRYIQDYSSKLDALLASGYDAGAPVYQSVLEEKKRFEYSLYEAKLTTKFLRENTQEDIAYRQMQMDSFAEKLKQVLPESSDLRFHGTPVYFAEEILKSGGISSTAKRFDGYVKSTDLADEISVSDVSSLHRTVNFFLDMTAYQRCLPAGCLFVLDGSGQTEKQHAGSLMNSVDFRKDPDQLIAIVSSPENEANIRQWLCDSGLAPELAYTFDGFLSEMEILHTSNRLPAGSSLSSSAAELRTPVSKPNLDHIISYAESRTSGFSENKRTNSLSR